MIWNMFFQNMKEKQFLSRMKEIIKVRNGKSKYSVCMLMIILSMIFCGCARLENEENGENSISTSKETDKLRIVTTIFPQYDFVRQIAGEKVSLQMLLKPGEETHSYEPTPQDIIAIQKADLFIYVGGENDSWVEDILESPEMNQVNTLRLVDCVDTLEEEQVEGMQEERGEYDHDEEAGHEEDTDEHTTHKAEEHDHTMDEHVWTSPKNAARIVNEITEQLCILDESHSTEYEENAETYTARLMDLDKQFRQVVGRADNHTMLFGDRFPFRYFADEYDLQYYAAFPGCASDTEPSAATMAFLINKVKEEQIPVVLKMELSNENIANAIAEATGAEVKVFYSCHNLTAEEFEAGETYLSLMQKNVETLKEALGVCR